MKVTIRGSEPSTWRCVAAPERFAFCQFHQAIQKVFGWYGYHLREFEFKRLGLLIKDPGEEDDPMESCSYDVLGEGTQTRALIMESPRFIYTYDFRDAWEHQIFMEKEMGYKYSYPQVLKYRGNNVPEDCGGIGDYYDLSDQLADPEAEEHDLMEKWASRQGMKEYGLDKVDANLKAHPAFGQGGAGDGQEDAVRERGVQGDAAQRHGAQKHLVQTHVSREYTAHKQVTGPRDTGRPETQRPAPGVIHRLEDLFSRFGKTGLLCITRAHHIGGCDELGKNKPAPALAAALLDSRRMDQFFGTISDETTAEFEKAAATKEMKYQGDLEAFRFLYYGGYCRFASMGTTAVPSDVAEAYDGLNTEKFRSERYYHSQVWACCEAAVYLYGAADTGQVGTVCKTVGCEADAREITRLCHEVRGVWADFVYWDGRLIDWDLVQADAYKDVLNYQKGKKFYIPSAAQVEEIARTGAVEIKRHIRPLEAFLLAMIGCGEEIAQEATSSIHHHIKLGTTPKTVEDITEYFKLNLDSQEKMNGFDEIMEQV